MAELDRHATQFNFLSAQASGRHCKGLVLWHRLARLLNSFSPCSFHWSVNGKSLGGLASSSRSQWNLSGIQVLGFCFRTIPCLMRWLTNFSLSWAIALDKSQQSTKQSLRRKTLPPWLIFDYSKDDSCSIRMPLHVEHLRVSFDLFRDASLEAENIPLIARNSRCLDQMLCRCFKCSVRTTHLYEASSSCWPSSVSAMTHCWEEFFSVFVWFNLVHRKLSSCDYVVIVYHDQMMPTLRELLKDYLPITLDLVKTTSLVVIAASGIHFGYHFHEIIHEGLIWRDPPVSADHAGHHHWITGWPSWFDQCVQIWSISGLSLKPLISMLCEADLECCAERLRSLTLLRLLLPKRGDRLRLCHQGWWKSCFKIIFSSFSEVLDCYRWLAMIFLLN